MKFQFSSNKPPQTILLTGRDEGSLEKAALELVDSLLEASSKQHPDFYPIRPEGKLGLHSIDRMRNLKSEIYLPPFQSKKRVFVLFEAEKMWPQAANSLLKALEEPSTTSYIILTSSQKEKIIPTLISRCQTFQVEGDKQKKEVPVQLVELLNGAPYTDALLFFERVKAVSDLIENKKKKLEKELEIEEDLNPFLRERKEKENEGIIKRIIKQDIELIFQEIYRNYPEQIKWIKEAKLKEERSCSFAHILESLLIKLGMI